MTPTEEEIMLESIAIKKVIAEEQAKERRRYALLQAAASIDAAIMQINYARDKDILFPGAIVSIKRAEELLSAIERRERESDAR